MHRLRARPATTPRRVLPLVVLAVLLGWWAVPSGSAGAHSVLESSSPAPGETLDAPPREITLTFNEPVIADDGAVRLLDADGDDLDIGAPRSVDAVVTAVVPGDLDDGSYVVAWKVMSADSHPVSGAFTFAVGAPTIAAGDTTVLDRVTAAEATSPGARALADVAAGLAYAGVLTAIGAAVFLAFVEAPGPADAGTARRSTARRIVLPAATVGAVGLVSSVFTEAIVVDGGGIVLPSWDAVADQVTGASGWQCLVGVVGLSVLATSVRPGLRSLVARVMTIDGALLAIAAFTIVGHTRTASPVAFSIAADVVHLGAAAIWGGGLVALLVHLRSGDDASTGADAATVARFSTMAGGAVVVVAAAGVLLGWRIVGSWDALWSTTYGVLLLVKVGLFLGVVAVGAYNRFRLVDRVAGIVDRSAARPVLRRTLAAEAVIILAIVGVTGVLTSISPEDDPPAAPVVEPLTCQEVAEMEGMPGMEDMDHSCVGTTTTLVPFDPTESAGSSGSTVVESDAFGDGLMLVTVAPAEVGDNTISISLTDADGASLDPADPPRVELRLRDRSIGPIAVVPERVGPGSYRFTEELVLPGEWEINVSAVLSDFEQPQAVVKIPVG